MAFKPKSVNENTGSTIDYNAINQNVKGGSRPSRVSLIVDLGTQEREPFTEDYKETPAQEEAIKDGVGWVDEVDDKKVFFKEQAPNDQIAVFVDLTSDVVDHGEDIGKQPYRLMVNSSFMGDIKGISFSGCYSFDKDGSILKDKGFTFHSNSVLTKLANATKQTQIVSGSGDDNMDVTQLLDKPLMVTVKKDERKDNTYINYKGCSEVPMVPSDPSDPDSDEVALNVKPLKTKPLVITFDNITPEVVKFLRGDVIKKIKKATNYEGSKMQEVLEAANKSKAEKEDDAPSQEENKKKKAPAKAKKVEKVEETDDNPFEEQPEELF
jgi:hypothetical protein